ncbi:tumor necrosis factor receptor superfamily member 1B isoform X2 [Meriones unguiculatus]|uniref:tumor necrosis factor receptor superfamily member 1B isoform X2 n=1 Tax=Meriones unguiculatus TaxID=10047 RepID=UPI000B4FBF49|nr:tumor necrosis factor receptor superfamily member 1B isoform X2 [Meriones unguiculatus]
MAPTALWVALVVELQLWAAGHTVPAQTAQTPYTPEPQKECRSPKEYYDRVIHMCCAECPLGQRVKDFCNRTSDTVCADCEEGMYTELWNHLSTCLRCSSFCHPGSKNGNVVCRACAPGTFSDTTSSTDVCKPHRTCSILAIPGNASTDAVCAPQFLTPSTVPRTVHISQPEPTGSQPPEPELGSSQTPNTSSVISTPKSEQVTVGGISLPIGLIVGVTALGLMVLGFVNCFILVQKKKKPSCLQREAKVPHLPDEQSRGATGLEQQHLLATAPSSSSSSLESSASARDRRVPLMGHPQATAAAGAQGSQEACAGSRSSDSSQGSHGTHVNVTCIVNVCSGSEHGSQCSSQASATVGDPDANPSASPKDEQVPFSQEECPSQSQMETPETLRSQEKPLPLGVPDVGMKPSPLGWYDQLAV